MPAEPTETRHKTLILALRAGDSRAAFDLLLKVDEELRRIARRLMKSEPAGHTLQATALINEAVIRLVDGNALRNVRSAEDVIALAVTAMRRTLIDHARARRALIRGGDFKRQPIDAILDVFVTRGAEPERDVELLEVIERLAGLNQRQADVVTLRFQGHSVKEIAALLDQGVSTIEGDLRKARAYLKVQLG